MSLRLTSRRRLVAIALAAVWFAGCKTVAPGSQVKDDDLGGSASGAATTWAGRMGLTLTDGGGGCQVGSVAPASFAQAIGLASGDVIQQLNSQPTNAAADFEAVANSFATGSAGVPWDGVWTFTVSRGGQRKTIQRPAGYDCNPIVLAECGPLQGPK
jgi:S1-C subfamily serine protease